MIPVPDWGCVDGVGEDEGQGAQGCWNNRIVEIFFEYSNSTFEYYTTVRSLLFH
jgi:hypothetical protein